MKSKTEKFYTFNKNSLSVISRVLKTKLKKIGNFYRYELCNEKEKRKLALEIYPDILIGDKVGTMVSVYALNSFLQLHFCTGFAVSETLNEVTFIGDMNGKLSGLIVEREAGCSLYANVDRKILSGDFTRLAPEVMMSGIALSLTESLFPEK